MAEESTSGLHPADAIAKLLEITPRRLQQLASEGYVPKAKRGLYPLIPCVQGYIRYLKAKGAKRDEVDDDPDELSYQREKALLTREQRKAAERENLIAEGKLIPAEDHELELATVFKEMAGFCDTLGDRLERDAGLTGHQVERLNALIDDERESFYRRLTA